MSLSPGRGDNDYRLASIGLDKRRYPCRQVISKGRRWATVLPARNPMERQLARTKFVRRVADTRPGGFDRYVEDLLRIERALVDGHQGVAATMALLNLISRYPRETAAIAPELATEVPRPPEEEKIPEGLWDRLRLS